MLRRLLIVFCAACALSACAVVRAGDPALYPPRAAERAVPVYVMYTWMHAELGLRSEDVLQRGGPAAEALKMLPRRDWVLIGWGDGAYYRERGWTTGRVFDFVRSMLPLDDPSVIEVNPEAAHPSPQSTGNEVLALQLTEAGYDNMLARMNEYFVTRNGEPLAVGRGRDPGSQFFLAHGESAFYNNSNHWVAHMLHAAGVPTTPLIDVVSEGLALDLRWRAGAEQVKGSTEAHEPEPETPPTHSGRYLPMAETAAIARGSLRFQGYDVHFADTVRVETLPLPLYRASVSYNAAGESFAELMNVPENSLVGIRRIVDVHGDPSELAVCQGGRIPAYLGFGFRTGSGGPYEIAAAAFAERPGPDAPASNLCAIAHYVQP